MKKGNAKRGAADATIFPPHNGVYVTKAISIPTYANGGLGQTTVPPDLWNLWQVTVLVVSIQTWSN